MKINKVIKSLETDNPRIRIANILHLAEDEVYTIQELKELTGLDTVKIAHILRERVLPKDDSLDRFRIGNMYYYGKKEAIEQLREGLKYDQSKRSH